MSEFSQNYHFEGEHPLGDTGQIVLSILFLLTWITDSFFIHLTDFPGHFIPVYVRIAAGLLTIALGFYLLRFHVSGYGGLGNTVVTDGPYKIVRHPIYTSVLLIMLGLNLTTLSMLGFIAWFILFFFYNYIAAYEEKVLIKKFNGQYINYMKKVFRWFPRFIKIDQKE